jgi:hypothetical protein
MYFDATYLFVFSAMICLNFLFIYMVSFCSNLNLSVDGQISTRRYLTRLNFEFLVMASKNLMANFLSVDI